MGDRRTLFCSQGGDTVKYCALSDTAKILLAQTRDTDTVGILILRNTGIQYRHTLTTIGRTARLSGCGGFARGAAQSLTRWLVTYPIERVIVIPP